jgi:hypothetical protein
MKTRLITIAAFLVFAAIHLHAGSAACTSATVLATDSSILDFDNIQPAGTNWYQFTAAAGRSYSIEVRDDVDSTSNDLQVTYYGPNSTCTNLLSIPASIASVTDTRATEPVLPANASASRSSIVTCPVANFTGSCAASGAGTYLVAVQNSSTTLSHYVRLSVTETTMFSTWSTYSGLNTQYGFYNITSQTLAYTITMTSYSSATQASTVATALGTMVGFSGSPQSVLGTGPGALGLTTGNQSGNMVFTHNGPPGAIQPTAMLVNYGTTPLTLVPIPIGPVRGK